MERIQYTHDRPRQAYELALLGLTEIEMARVMGIDPKTIQYWKKVHPRFAQKIEAGKTIANAKVASALFKRAVGFSHEDIHISNYKGDITITPYTKHYPPDTAACIKWLSLRDPQRWSEVQRMEITNNVKIVSIDLTGFSMEELKVAEKLGLKAHKKKDDIVEDIEEDDAA